MTVLKNFGKVKFDEKKNIFIIGVVAVIIAGIFFFTGGESNTRHFIEASAELNRKSRSESIKLRATVGRLVSENNNLKEQLAESRREIGSLRQEIRNDAESATAIISGIDSSKSTTGSIREDLSDARKYIERSIKILDKTGVGE